MVKLSENFDRPKERSTPAKVREPDTFDGTEPSKLRPFLVQCQLNFRDRPEAFSEDPAKINFAISYLKGFALAWFEPYLLEDTRYGTPDCLLDYSAFCKELQEQFGPLDPTGTAESELENLRMKDSHRIAKYLVSFNRLATQTGWDSSALRHIFYRGLPDRIKDQMSQVGKPSTLLAMKNLAQQIDARYWERKAETSRDNRTATSVTNSKPSDPKKSTTPAKSSDKPSTSATPKRPDLTDKLGKDGKLTQAERQRRMDNKLCMFCGGPGHIAANCTKKGSSASKTPATKPKARAANAVQTPDESEK
jgi:Retrotransposon gag protein.